MGYKKTGSKGYQLESNRAEIIARLPYYDSLYRAADALAKEFQCSPGYVRRHIAKWKKQGFVSEYDMKRMSISEFKEGWSEVREPVIITISRVDRFELKPIDKDADNG